MSIYIYVYSYKYNLLEDIFSVLKSKEWNGVSHHPEIQIKNH